MHSILRVFFAGLVLGALAAGLATAQSTFNFNLLLTPASGSPGTISNNSTVNLVGQVGTQTSVTITATYTGTSQATISTPTSTWVLGSTEITVALVKNTVPFMLGPGQSFSFTVTYDPTNASGVSAQITVPYTEPGTSTTTVSNAIVLLFNGLAPAFTLSYVLQPDNNVIQISSGGAIPFHPTQLNTTATGDLNISDTGSGQGTITAISLSTSSVFKLSGTPLFPYTLSSTNATLSIGILYTPTAVESDTAQITITYLGGVTNVVNLTGSGATSSYTYSYLSATGTPTPVKSEGTITLPAANAPTSSTPATTSSTILTVTNSGNANGTINSVNVTGPFQLTGLPVTPPTLTPGGNEGFTITFTPTQVGTQTGTLVVGSDRFTLSGQGLGPKLTFSYTSSAGTKTLGTGDAVVFTPVSVSQSEKVTFIVTNSGTSTTTISNISTSPPFSLTPAPSLPLTLASGQSSQFGITFTPVTVATITGLLQIDTTTVQLIGSGTAPPALPSYSFAGPSGDVPPASQPNVSLTLATSYPLDLTGVLTLTTSGSLGTDPNVQFSSGGRTVDFTIPANSTSADFAGQGSQIPLQTGTVAETVTLTPSFATTDGVDVTPSSPPTLQFTVPSEAPVLLTAQVANQADNGFDLVLVGYSTTRSLGSLTVIFNPATGYNIGTSQLTIDLTLVSLEWFQSSTSIAFGGQFQITAPFILQGTPPKGQTLIDSVASVAATVGNAIGTSNSLQTNVQ